MSSWTTISVLNWAASDFQKRGLESPRLEAELLLAHVLGCRRLDLYLAFDRPLEQRELSVYRETIARRRNGEPSAYITGVKEFWSLELAVDERVLVPRPETEHLVETVLGRIDRGMVLDLCTGSGCVAIALAVARPELKIDAVDISEGACAIATKNAIRHGVEERVSIFHGDLFAPLPPQRRYEAIAANPPYVAEGELESLAAEVQREPRLALAGGADGLDVIRKVLVGAPGHLAPGGLLVVELDPRQAEAAASELGPSLFGARGEILRDLAGRERLVVWRVR